MRVFGLRGGRRSYALISVPCRLSNAAMRALTAAAEIVYFVFSYRHAALRLQERDALAQL